MSKGAANAQPGTADAALTVVAQAAEAQGLAPGTLVQATGGAKYTLQNAGNVTTQIFENGRILVQQGEKVILDVITKVQ